MTMKAKRRARRRPKPPARRHPIAGPTPLDVLTLRAAGKLERRDLTVRAAPVEPESLDAETRSVEAVLATESRVRVLDLSSWRVIEEILVMRGCRHADQVPLLDSHNRWSVQDQLGSVRGMEVGSDLRGRLHFSSDADSERAWIKVREGHLKDVSIGYRVANGVTIEPGKSAKVNGRNYTASPKLPLRIALEWEVREASVTPIGADGAAGIRDDVPGPGRNRATTPSREERAMTFDEWVRSKGFDPEELSDAQRAYLTELHAAERAAAGEGEGQRTPAPPPAPPAPAAPPAERQDVEGDGDEGDEPDLDARADAALARAQQRRDALDTQIRQAGEGFPEEVVTRALKAPDLGAAQAVYLAHVRSSRPAVGGGPGIHVQGEATRQHIEVGLLSRGSMLDDDLAKRYGEKVADQAQRFADMSLVDVCRLALRLEGQEIPVGRNDAIRAAFSTVTLPKVLGSVVHASLMRGYTNVEGSWRTFCNIGSLSDFKAHTRIRVTDRGDWEAVNNAGEIAHGTVSEEYEEITASTKGKMFTCTRQDIINDNVDVLTRTPQRIGRRGALHVSKTVFEHFMANPTMSDTVALFHATHRNLNTSTALTAANFGVAVTAMRKQYDADGEPIDVGDLVLIVPPDLVGTGREILRAGTIVITGSTDAARANANAWQGEALLASDPRLSNANYTNYATTTWYLAGDPKDGDTIEVGFLNGNQNPIVEEVDLPANVLGRGWRAYLDFGVRAIDWRRLQKNTA